jgi:hypothetical protein
MRDTESRSVFQNFQFNDFLGVIARSAIVFVLHFQLGSAHFFPRFSFQMNEIRNKRGLPPFVCVTFSKNSEPIDLQTEWNRYQFFVVINTVRLPF